MTISPFATPRASISGPSGSASAAGSVPQPINRNQSAHTARRASVQVGPPPTLKPIGIVNEQNTCFLNSTFQAVSLDLGSELTNHQLSATTPLISILTSSPETALPHSSTSQLPQPTIPSARIPYLQPETLEPPVYDLLPVTRAFSTSVQKSWKMKDAGGGTSGAGESSSTRSMTLRTLLKEMAKKYDQYDDYAQQDAHELLRHLLDSMGMEEKDVIKRLQPQPPPSKTRRKSRSHAEKQISPLASPLPSPGVSLSSSPVKQKSVDTMTVPAPVLPSRSSSMSSASQTSVLEREIPESERMVPFVDVLFGGSFASVVVCENCKSRDRLKAMAQRFRPGKSSGSETHQSSGGVTVVSDTELSDTESKERDRSGSNRRASMDQYDRPAEEIHRSGSSKGHNLKTKTSFSFRRRGSKPKDGAPSIQPIPEPEKPPSFKTPPALPSVKSHFTMNGSGPTAAQSAYIQRILSGPVAEPEDPLQRLKRANSGDGEGLGGLADSGLEESLKAFTSVEVLEGENAFACKKCWKVKTGRYKGTQATVQEEDEDAVSPTSSPLFAPLSSRSAPPSISIVGSDSASRQGTLDGDRDLSVVSQPAGGNARPGRAPSPLRDRTDDVKRALFTESATLNPTESALADDESDGLSDFSSEEEPPQPIEMPIGRPKMPQRKKSSHFVMRRAFKRYLIAKAPEVLVFHFKRFKQTQKTGLTFTNFYDLKKMDDFVSFPETLDLAPFLAPNRNDYKVVPTSSGPRAPYMNWDMAGHGPEMKPVLYRLYAVVVHLGTMVGGHYIAYCLVDPEKMFAEDGEPADGMSSLSLNGDRVPHSASKRDRRVWCYCSDTSIRLASIDEVLQARAYLCFYEKVPA